jgi:CubicO group peptidase (beta-lactamase class C family)
MDLQKFTINVGDQLKDRTVGWGLAVYMGTELKHSNSGGNAVLAPATKMTSNVRMSVMSMSKTVTASAIISILPGKGLTVDSPIAPHLPASWAKGPNIDQLTFRMVFTHTTGLTPVSQGPDTDPNAYANLRAMIANGVPGGVPAQGKYLNQNYALMRVVLPYLWHGSEVMDFMEQDFPDFFPQFVANTYGGICKAFPLANPALAGVSDVPTGPLPVTRVYDFQDTTQSRPSGQMSDDLHAGPDHWYMSAREYGRFIVDLRLGTYVGGTACWKTMSQSRAPNPGPPPAYPTGDARCGMWRFAGQHGEYFGHNGEYSDPKMDVVGSFAGWMAFPNDVTGVFVANSNLWFKYEQEKILMDAYDQSW